MSAEIDETARHKAKMAKRKAAQDAEVAAKTVEKGLLIVHTGKGKGKSTAAFGPAAARARPRLPLRRRAVRQGRLADRASATALERFGDQVEWHTHGRGLHLGDAGPRARCRGRRARLGQGARS